MPYLYRHIRLDKNEPFYIGIGGSNKYEKEGLYTRAHSKYYNNRSKQWFNIINKTSYEVEIMLDDLTWEQACEKEIEFIKLYGRKDLGLGPLVNMTNGGEGEPGYVHTEKTKQILRRPCSDQTKVKLSNAHKGKKFSSDHKQKISIAGKGKHAWTEEKRQSFIILKNKPVIQYAKNGEILKEFKSIKAACEFLNIPKNAQANISKCISNPMCKNGKARSAYGYHWKFKDKK